MTEWEEAMISTFTQNGWNVEVICCDYKGKSYFESVIDNLPLEKKNKLTKTKTHPQFIRIEDLNVTSGSYVICNESNLHFATSKFPKANLIWYRLGAGYSKARFNYATTLDVLYNKGVTPVSLFIRKANENLDTRIFTGYTTTDSVSIHRNNKQAGFMAYRLLSRFASQPEMVSETKSKEIETIKRVPGQFQIFAKLATHYFNYVWKRKITKIPQSQWSIQLTNTNITTSEKTDFAKLNWKDFNPFGAGQYADPFIFEKNGQTAVYFEYIPKGSSKGELRASLIDKSGSVIESDTILKRNYHLAYPFVFQYQDQLLMIPDSGHNETVDLYRCMQFPFKWEFVKTLIDGIKMVDCTILLHDNTWWMFGNIAEREELSSFDYLHIYHTTDPIQGTWKPHNQNPIVVNANGSRPAGRIWHDGVSWIRPSQNSSYHYGYGLNLNRIVELTDKNYTEEKIQSITPWSLKFDGIHTINATGNWTVIDIKRKI